MKCSQIWELLPDLTAGHIAAVPETNNHLSSCAACVDTIADFPKSMAVFDEWQGPAASQQTSWFAWGHRRPSRC